MKNKKIIFEIIGWYGAIALLAAYALVSLGITPYDSLVYQLINLSGGIGIIIIALHKKLFQSVFLNVIWSIVAIAAIIS